MRPRFFPRAAATIMPMITERERERERERETEISYIYPQEKCV